LKAIGEYEKAIALNRSEPVYYEELDALYEMSNAPVEKRMKLFEGSNDVVRKRDDAFVHQVTVLTLAGKPEMAVEYLEGRKFNYREGDSMVRNVIIDAHLMLGKKFYDAGKFDKALSEFLKAQVPEEEAGDSRSGNRNFQVDWFIGRAYEALGNKPKAKSYFISSAGNNETSNDFTGFYQGLSYQKNGNKKRAEQIFNSLIAAGEKETGSKSPSPDFFAKFGEKEAENARLSNSYMIIGLGYKGLGNKEKAKENLVKATELSAGNLWAKVELEESEK
jgi:tetratricopeptide (TPR) repeat protein